MKSMKKLITICGSDGDDKNLSNYTLKIGEEIGRLVAKKNGVIVCGGRGGVMRAACKGAKKENGLTIGILPGAKDDANEFIDIAIPTTIGHIRNFLVANSGDVVIAIGGRWGTLNEISFSFIFGKPVILVKGTGGVVDEVINGYALKNIGFNYYIVESAVEAVNKAFEIIEL